MIFFIRQLSRAVGLFLFLCGATPITLGAQNEAIIIGKIDEPVSKTVQLSHYKELFSLEEGRTEANLDGADIFVFKLALSEPRVVELSYRDHRFRIFVAPNDSVKLRFSGAQPMATVRFSGQNADANLFLLQEQQSLQASTAASSMATARQRLSVIEYEALVERLYRERQRFLNNYSTQAKSNFPAGFLEYAEADVIFWRAYHMMAYARQKAEQGEILPDDFYTFVLETENVSPNSLHNPYYLRYLDLYLAYLFDRNKSSLPAAKIERVEERTRRSVQFVRSRVPVLKLVEEPLASKLVVGELKSSTVGAVFLNMLTTDMHRYEHLDTLVNDTLMKIALPSGVQGWVPRSYLNFEEKVVEDTLVRSQFCFNPEDAKCGFDGFLYGKVLYHVLAKHLLLRLAKGDLSLLNVQKKEFLADNTRFPEYNTILDQAFERVSIERAQGVSKLFIPPSCVVNTAVNTNVDVFKEPEVKPVVDSVMAVRLPDVKSIVDSIVAARSPEVKPVVDSVVVTRSPEVKPVVDSVVVTRSPEVKPVVDSVVVTRSPEVKPVVDSVVVTRAPEVKPVVDSVVATRAPEVKPVVDSVVVTRSPEVKPVVDSVVVTRSPEVKPVVDSVVVTRSPEVKPTIEPTAPVYVPEGTALLGDTTVKIKKVIGYNPITGERKVGIVTITLPKKGLDEYMNRPDVVRDPVKATTQLTSDRVRLDTSRIIMPITEFDPNQKAFIFKGLSIGAKIIPFEFVDINGQEIRQQDLLGKVVILDFWATWCGPCQASMQHTQDLARRYKDNKDVVFIYLSIDKDAKAWRSTLKERQYTGIHVNDAYIAPINFQIQALPNYFIIGKNGQLAYNSLLESPLTDANWIDYLLKMP